VSEKKNENEQKKMKKIRMPLVKKKWHQIGNSKWK